MSYFECIFYSFFFALRGDIESEGHLVEVNLSRRSLRSRGSFVLVSTKAGKLWVWHGIKTSSAARRVAVECANAVAEQKRVEMGFGELFSWHL